MKKILAVVLVIITLICLIGAWMFLASGTGFDGKKETLYISSNAATKEAVLDSMKARQIISKAWAFNFLADRMNYWQSIKPGKYEIEKGSSILSIIRKLRNGQQTPVNLVITKLRTKEDFARLAGNRFEFDSSDMMAFLNSADSLKDFDVDTTTVISLILPDTYTYFWNTTPRKVVQKLAAQSTAFWTAEKKQQAAQQGLEPVQVYTLASIVEEETTNNKEKGVIASVYLNRLRKGMPLQADPTVKFAARNFALKRVAGDVLQTPSSYNTYRNKGLPPGPICTPSTTTINAVLTAPATDYLYFVASPSLKQEHDFSVTYEEHMQKAKRYHSTLDSLRKAGRL
jgi:UPF0755 protein